MKDIVIVSVPYTIIEVPPLALAVLKGAIEHEGFSCNTYDLGLELLLSVNKDRKKFEEVQLYFYEPDLVHDVNNRQYAENFITKWAEYLLSLNTRWIGISVFSEFSQTGTYLLAKRIKELKPSTKIVIGGNGAGVHILDTAKNLLGITKLENLLTFDKFLKKRNLVDVYITGDGEMPLIELLKTDLVEEGKFFHSNYSSDDFPFSNFDDFKLDHYEGQLGKLQLPVFTSKGCVRNCDFCDVNNIQGNKYRYRTGTNLVKEMLYLKKRYNVNHFLCNDSLANGSMKNLKEMCTGLAKWNKENPFDQIRWAASGWISRPPGQQRPEFYSLLEESGLESVSIGVETGSDHVLHEMGKKTIVDGLYWDAKHFKKHNIGFVALMIIGHWSERWEDFLQTCVMFAKLLPYARSGTLMAASLGATYSVHTNTPAWDNRSTNGLQRFNSRLWWTDKNPNLTYKERTYRWILFHKLLEHLKVPVSGQSPAKDLMLQVKEEIDSAREYYTNIVPDPDKIVNMADYYYKNFDEFVSLVLDKTEAKSKVCSLKLELEVESTDEKLPRLEIKNKDTILLDQVFSEGNHTVVIDNVCLYEENELSLRFSNKGEFDTIVDEQGRILKDKYIKIKKFVMDDIDIIQDADYFYNYIEYYENNQRTSVKEGFYHNESYLICRFSDPFVFTYNEQSTRFSKFNAYLTDRKTKPGSRLVIENPEYCREEIAKALDTLKF